MIEIRFLPHKIQMQYGFANLFWCVSVQNKKGCSYKNTTRDLNFPTRRK
jgi:hypothetical protein